MNPWNCDMYSKVARIAVAVVSEPAILGSGYLENDRADNYDSIKQGI